MKIAQIAPIIERIPPKTYGGTERVVSALTDELVRRGHEVTLFASGDSITKAEVVSVVPISLREMKVKNLYGPNIRTWQHLGFAYQRYKEFDIIHDHNTPFSLPIAEQVENKTLFTMHGPFTLENRKMFTQFQRPGIVTISQAQALAGPPMQHLGTVYNGLPLEHMQFSPTHDGYLLFVGRISMEKGVHLAIEVAQYLNIPLIIAAKLDTVDYPYYHEYVEPHLSESIQWVGEVSEQQRNQLYSRAMAFLHPVTWREPFGLTLIEAMACGCPVVAISKGSIPEIVEHRKTGFVVSDIEEMIDAVCRIGDIQREDCRSHVLKKFSAAAMAKGYEEVYKRFLQQ